MKTAGLLFDVLDVCPNTKLLGSKVQKAVVTLLQEKAVVFDHKMKEQDGVDRIDQMRVLRLSSEIRGRVFRMLSTAEQTQLEMCLDKVKLPRAILAHGLGGGSYGDSEENSEPVLAVVPFEAKPVEEVEPSPKEPQESLAKAHDRVVPVAPAVAAPAIFQKILDRHGNTLVSAKQCLAPTGASSTLSSDEELLAMAMAHVPKQCLV